MAIVLDAAMVPAPPGLKVPLPAEFPIAMLLLPVTKPPATTPTATLPLPVTAPPVTLPTATLLFPVTRSPVLNPTAVFALPATLLPAANPNAELPRFPGVLEPALVPHVTELPVAIPPAPDCGSAPV